MTNGKRTLARRKRIYTAQQEQNLGYRVHWKRFYIAYFIEAAIVGASVFAGWQFANRYAGDEPAAGAPMQVAALGSWIMPTMHHSDAWKMAIIATLAIAAAELARLPLVQGFRTQRSKILRGFLLLGVLMMCVVTTKSMSQVMEQMFHPRLRFVQTASADLKIAQAEYGKIDAQRGGAQANAKPLTESVERLDAQITELNKSLQGLGPRPRPIAIAPRPWTDKKGIRHKGVTTYRDAPWSGDAIIAQINDARAKRQQAAERQNDAGMTVVNFDQHRRASQPGHDQGKRLARSGQQFAAAFVHRDGVRQRPGRGDRWRGALVPAVLRFDPGADDRARLVAADDVRLRADHAKASPGREIQPRYQHRRDARRLRSVNRFTSLER